MWLVFASADDFYDTSSCMLSVSLADAKGVRAVGPKGCGAWLYTPHVACYHPTPCYLYCYHHQPFSALLLGWRQAGIAIQTQLRGTSAVGITGLTCKRIVIETAETVAWRHMLYTHREVWEPSSALSSFTQCRLHGCVLVLEHGRADIHYWMQSEVYLRSALSSHGHFIAR
jgi:hypothetical protein